MIGVLISKLELGEEMTAKDIDLFRCMCFIDIAIKDVTKETVLNCFRKAKFDFHNSGTQILIAEQEEEECDFWEQLRSQTNIEFDSFESYVTVDDNESVEYESDLTDN